jgi:hypothetical protein
MKFESNSRALGVAELRTRVLGLGLGVVMLGGCGGGSANSSSSSGGTVVNNTAALAVNLGPANNFVNGLYTSVTICEPGSSTCQTLPNVSVDTGSVGLRILSSELTVSLPQTKDSGGNALQSCIDFADGSYAWGPVATADIQIAGEKASSVPVQIISANPAFAVPSGCVGTGLNDNTVDTLGGTAILGIGNFQQDCGTACTSVSTSTPPVYYLCSNSVCHVATVPLSTQLQNPVWMFPQDNNGVLVSLPSIPATGQASAQGSLIFGIGTQADNAVGSASVYTTDNAGNFVTTFRGVAYNQSFLDTGSGGFYFLDAMTVGIPDCSSNSGFYCPAATVNYTATNTGLNGTSGQVSFSIANADALFTSNNAAFNDVGGSNPGSFDWGMPFFFGRKVFIGIEGQSSPAGVGPYWAY